MERFVPEGDCWLWRGAFFPDGYPQISYRNRATRVNRAVMELVNGVPGLIDGSNPVHVLHSCDNRRCVNPSHLFLGTNADNMRDRNQKGRTAKGERHWNARLSSRSVGEVRRLAKQGVPTRQIASQFGVTAGHVWSIVQGRTWRG